MNKGIMMWINRKLKGTRDESGFTLIELLVVIVILGILAAILIPKIATSSDEAKKSTCETNMNMIESAAQRYYFDNDAYPALGDLEPDYLNQTPVCPFGDLYTIDATGNVNRAAHAH
ncbi:competence type IV pilus major pilin ComGC [Phosphitispora sp. TUW77]|uniref:competence type IV pilus major pilin ComGC n=1 Tax=Phosphitispora sp. TUW77 TaxID=3152361 RepID=UPI003AB2980A